MASAEDDDADGSMCSMKVVVNCVGDFGARIYRLELIRKVPVGPQNSAGVVLPPSDDVVFLPLSANKQKATPSSIEAIVPRREYQAVCVGCRRTELSQRCCERGPSHRSALCHQRVSNIRQRGGSDDDEAVKATKTTRVGHLYSFAGVVSCK